MFIYECELTLLENTFFSSREVNNFYQTEPLIGNYALAYALKFVESPYSNNGEIHYYEDLSKLNHDGIYITPAKFIKHLHDDKDNKSNGKVKFSLSQFNSISDSYWSKMEQNAISTNRNKKAEPINYPQIGWIKMLSLGNIARFYIFSEKDIQIKKYIRLGKFMSKAKIKAEKVDFKVIEANDFLVKQILNPLDIPKNYKLKAFDTYSVNPTILVDNVSLNGDSYKLKHVELPVGMKFGVEFLKGKN